MMTKEEIQEARKVRYDEQAAYSARVYHDYCERALGLLPKALNALEAANRKLDRVKALWEKWDEEADFAACNMDPLTAETLNRCVQQIGEILLGESTT